MVFRLDRQCTLKLGGIEQFPVSSTPAPIRWMSLETLTKGDIQARSIVVNIIIGPRGGAGDGGTYMYPLHIAGNENVISHRMH